MADASSEGVVTVSVTVIDVTISVTVKSAVAEVSSPALVGSGGTGMVL